MRKVRGVEKVTVSLKNGLTVLELSADNTVTLSSLRTVIKNNGFVSKEATIVAAGVPTGRDFVVSGTREQLVASAPPTSAPDGHWQFVVAQ